MFIQIILKFLWELTNWAHMYKLHLMKIIKLMACDEMIPILYTIWSYLSISQSKLTFSRGRPIEILYQLLQMNVWDKNTYVVLEGR